MNADNTISLAHAAEQGSRPKGDQLRTRGRTNTGSRRRAQRRIRCGCLHQRYLCDSDGGRSRTASRVQRDVREYITRNRISIAIAANTDRGLIATVIHDIDEKSFPELETERSRVVEQTLADELQPHQLKGGTFTVSNLGSFGVKSFTPIIHPRSEFVEFRQSVECSVKRRMVISNFETF